MMANGGGDQNRSVEKQVHRSSLDNAAGAILAYLFDGLREIDWSPWNSLVNPDSLITHEARALRHRSQNQPLGTFAELDICSWP